MLARRLISLQGCCAHRVAGLSTHPGNEADRVLAYWQSLLQDRAPEGGQLEEGEVKELLATAIRLRQGKAQSTLPEQLIALFMDHYRGLDPQGRLHLFRTLTADFDVQHRDVEGAIAAWQQAAGRVPISSGAASEQDAASEALSKAARRLSAAAQPLYSHLFVPISQQPAGIKFLVDLRADLLASVQQAPSGAAPLRALGEAIRGCLAEWFSVGLLQLRRLTWEGSSAGLLEKVMGYEAVHRMSGWPDLKQRLGPCRRVFAFFHQAMPDEPLVVLHTALLSTPPAATMQQILSGVGDCQDGSTTAIFYSITSTQKGLTGVDLGNFLIKQVAHRLVEEFPSLTTLCTLSPMPGFAAWLDMRIARGLWGLDAEPLVLPSEWRHLAPLAEGQLAEGALSGGAGSPQAAAALLQWCLKGDRWLQRPQLEWSLHLVMLRLAAVYLLQEKRRGLALDPVANFHLRNGAQLWRLNWRADTSAAGLARSHGLMVNYMYELDQVAENNRRYLVDGEVVAGPQVLRWLEEPGQAAGAGAAPE